MLRRWLVAALPALLLTAMARPAPPRQSVFVPGAVVALQGTPHLWFADDQGVLHWGGDTRALASHFVDWSKRVEVTLDVLRAQPRGDPWLSAGLLKDGDPIYLVKWESDQTLPTLLHIQSILDVELFGIDTSNYGRFVLDRAEWERRFGAPVSALATGTLAAAAATPVPSPTATPVPPPTVAPQPTATPEPPIQPSVRIVFPLSDQTMSGEQMVKAQVADASTVSYDVDDGPAVTMTFSSESQLWQGFLNSWLLPNGRHNIAVTAQGRGGATAADRAWNVLVQNPG